MKSAGKHRGLDRTQLKLLAILAMVVDHTAWGFVEFMSPLGQIMHLFGRLTLPIMCFFIAEGFRHTSNIRHYVSRMATFALLAVCPFYLFFHEEYLWRQNIIFDLLLALLTLCVTEHKAFPKPLRITLVCLLIAVSLAIGGWVVMPILYVLIFYYSRDFKTTAVRFIAATCLLECILLPTIWLNQQYHFSSLDWTIPERLYLFGFIFSLIPLYFYNGEKGRNIGGRYFFYIFYPAHFLILKGIQFLRAGASAQEIYIHMHIIALFIGIGLLIYVLRQPNSRAQTAVVFFLVCSVMYIFGFLLEITTDQVAGVYTATKLQYFAEVMVMIAVTLCAQELFHIRIPTPVYAAETLVSLFVMHCMFTFEKNGLMYTGISINRTAGPFPRMEIEGYGPAFYVFVAYCIFVCFMVIGCALHSTRRNDTLQKRRLRLLLCAMITMWLHVVIKATGITGGYEIPALFIPIAAGCIILALVKYSYLDSVNLGISNAINQGSEGILIIDSNHRILYSNEWVHRLFGEFAQYDDAYRIPAVHDAFTGVTETISLEGHTYELRVEPLTEQGHTTGEILWIFDLTEHYRYLEKMKEASSKDSLTGLNNRQRFENALRELLKKRTAGAFFMADLDHFKQVNDTYGHQVGDRILTSFAEAVRHASEVVPEGSLLTGRIGGDEFCLFYCNQTDRRELEQFAQNLTDCFDEAIARAGHPGVTSLSLGITTVLPEKLPMSVWTASTLIKQQADKALYAAKEAGRKTWRFYEGDRAAH
ncbi:MAG: diguanylate cyclase [Lachnospiraceae bacterium]|nr:diguanylate cyclase [Lachnospiraceae bacterium]